MTASRKMLFDATIGKIAFSGDPRPISAAANSWVIPRYDAPTMPTLPLLSGSLAAQRMTSTLSRASCGSLNDHMPSDPPVPRTSTSTATYPRLA